MNLTLFSFKLMMTIKSTANGVNGARGRLVLKPAEMELLSRRENAIILHLLVVDHTVLVTKRRKKIATSNLAQLMMMANGVNGKRGLLVLKHVVVENQ